MCFCAHVPQIATRTRLLILQHPRERLHPFGTARMVAMALPNARIVVPEIRLSGALSTALDVPADAAVLFPHAAAIDLATLPAAERPSALVALDGTWSQARSLYRQNPWLQGLRHVRLHPEAPSEYRIRREPRADYVSTLEAILAALRILEPETAGLEGLRAAFAAMIDRQLERLDEVDRHGRYRRQRQSESQRIPAAIDAPHLVVAYAETALPDRDAQGGDDLGALLQWVGVRRDTGAVLDLVVNAVAPAARHLQHIGLCADDLAHGVSLEQARAQIAAFAGPTLAVAAWSPAAVRWNARLLPPASAALSLKVAYSNLRNLRAPELDAVLAAEGLAAAPLACRGRASARLSNALALADWLRSQRHAQRQGG